MSSSTKRTIKTLNNIQKTVLTNTQRTPKTKSSQNQVELMMEETKVEQTLIKQIQSAKKQIQKIVKQLNLVGISKEPSRQNQKCINQLYNMEKIIEEKNKQIGNINKEIKILKTQPVLQISQDFKKYKNLKNYQLSKLTQQILQQKSLLCVTQIQHKKLKNQLQHNKNAMKKTQQNYNNDPDTKYRKLMTYQQFLDEKKSLNQQTLQRQKKKNSKKYTLSIKQLARNEELSKNKSSHSINHKDAQAKRQIAQSALKVVKKKHQTEMSQLRGKLQFLKDQNQQLDIKLKNKILELQTAENRFSQTKKILIERR